MIWGSWSATRDLDCVPARKRRAGGRRRARARRWLAGRGDLRRAPRAVRARAGPREAAREAAELAAAAAARAGAPTLRQALRAPALRRQLLLGARPARRARGAPARFSRPQGSPGCDGCRSCTFMACIVANLLSLSATALWVARSAPDLGARPVALVQAAALRHRRRAQGWACRCCSSLRPSTRSCAPSHTFHDATWHAATSFAPSPQHPAQGAAPGAARAPLSGSAPPCSIRRALRAACADTAVTQRRLAHSMPALTPCALSLP